MATLKEITHRFETAARKADLLTAMQMASRFLGFDAFSVTVRLVHGEHGAGRIVMSSLPRDFLAWYDKERVAEVDPFLRKALGSTESFCSEEMEAANGGDALCCELKARLSQNYLSHSIYCSQHGANGATTIVGLFGRAGPADTDQVREQVGWITAHLHEALDRVVVRPIVGRRHPGALTRLERSMLELLARGYGAKEISRLLSVSPRSVRYYVERVREKLGARSLNHAMSRAIESRQVTLGGNALPSHWGGLPKLVMVESGASAWSVEEPSLEMSLREVCSSTSLTLFAQAVQHAVIAVGFQKFALVVNSPGVKASSQVIVTNDERAQRGRDNPGPLIEACLRPRPRDTRCIPVFRDEVLGVDAASDKEAAAAVPDIRAMLFAPDGTTAAFAMTGTSEMGADRFETRRSCFRMSREMHRAAARLTHKHATVLTPTEKLALLQMQSGATIRKVAKVQGQKERTMRYRVSRVAEKLGARNARHALAIATENGLLRREMGPVVSRDLVAANSFHGTLGSR